MNIGAAIVGGGLSYLGGERSNQANAKQAVLDRQFQSLEAVKNRNFQSDQVNRMQNFQRSQSGTVHQREVKDLIKAGLNPILSASKGAPAMSGGAASGAQGSGSRATMKDTITPAISSAMQLGRYNKELELLDAQIGKTKNDSRVSGNAGDITHVPASIANIVSSYISNSAKDIKNLPSNLKFLINENLEKHPIGEHRKQGDRKIPVIHINEFGDKRK